MDIQGKTIKYLTFNYVLNLVQHIYPPPPQEKNKQTKKNLNEYPRSLIFMALHA